MSQFTQPIRIYPATYKRLTGAIFNYIPPVFRKEQWVLGQDLSFFCDNENKKESCITVPKGFIFDGASVPFPLSILMPNSHPIYMPASLVHDWLYSDVTWRGSRALADKLFYDGMVALGTPKSWAWIMWITVRAISWIYWYWRRWTSHYSKDLGANFTHVINLDEFLDPTKRHEPIIKAGISWVPLILTVLLVIKLITLL